MTNDEIRVTKPATAQPRVFRHMGFGFLSSFVIQRLVQARFMVPMHAKKRKGALHEPECAAGILPADQSEKSTAGRMPAAPWRHRVICSRFMVPMHAKWRRGF